MGAKSGKHKRKNEDAAGLSRMGFDQHCQLSCPVNGLSGSTSPHSKSAGSTPSKLYQSPRKLDVSLPVHKLNLTATQIKLLQRSWSSIKKQKRIVPIGMDIFEYLCFRYPEIKKCLENKVLDGSASERKQNEPIKLHAISFMDTIDDLINNLETLDQVVPSLHRLGRMHAEYQKQGFHPKDFENLGEVSVYKGSEWTERRFKCPEFNAAYTELIIFLVKCLKEGYYGEIRRLRRASYLSQTGSLINTNTVSAYDIRCTEGSAQDVRSAVLTANVDINRHLTMSLAEIDRILIADSMENLLDKKD